MNCCKKIFYKISIKSYIKIKPVSLFYFPPNLLFRVAMVAWFLAEVNGRKIVAENIHRKTLRAEQGVCPRPALSLFYEAFARL